MRPKIYYWLFVTCITLVVFSVIIAVIEGGVITLCALGVAAIAAIAAVLLERKCKNEFD